MIKLKLSKKYSKSIFYLTISLLFVILFAFVSKNVFNSFSATYTNITTQVTVGNSAPTFTAGPTESAPGLSGGTSNSCGGAAVSGATITFSATGTDSNTHSYYFLVCSTSSVTPPGTAGALPTCAATAFCNSGATAIASGTATSCTYNSSSTTAWSTAWYGIVCDNYAANQLCTSSQGSGNSGSPLYVNHPPAFPTSSVSPTSGNPGTTFNWATSTGALDIDGHDFKLLVCKTNAMSSSTCTGGEWCNQTKTGGTNNPTCGITATAPYADYVYDAYPYIVDTCGLASSGAAQGVNRAFTVNNVAPSVASVTLNGGAAISLAESTTTAVSMTASVTDNNGCTALPSGNEINNVKGYLYRSSVTYATCDTAGEANNNNCYPEVSCSAGTCTNGVTTYTCSASLQHYADPTVVNTLFPSDTWLDTIKATDDDSATGTAQVAAGVELNTTIGGNTAESGLDYGTLVVGGENAPLDRTLTHNPTGNVGIDVKLKANTATMCTNYATCTGGTPIAIGNQKYALTSSVSWASGVALTTSAVEAEVNVQKQTSSTVPTKQTWWGMQIPSSILPGVYNGLNVVTYVLGETTGW